MQAGPEKLPSRGSASIRLLTTWNCGGNACKLAMGEEDWGGAADTTLR